MILKKLQQTVKDRKPGVLLQGVSKSQTRLSDRTTKQERVFQAERIA